MADGSVIFDTKIDSSGLRTGLAGLGKTALKGVGTAVAAIGSIGAAAGAAALALGKASVSAYADYEQLVGGVETLFGAGGQSLEEYAKSVNKSVSAAKGEYNKLLAAQEDVLSKAAGAYATAGLSANEYMETVTSFSASLIASLGGDTKKAAEYADIAITDMADNANKMGTDMELIQNSYQGFAKQNYTMLDNLKLGYGGTKTEMERLLKDAQKISGIKYDISSYADIVSAIHVIQEEMGIAGATAQEAEHTISGSIGALKAAFGNLLVGFGDADADVEALCNTVIKAFETVLDNVTPIIKNIVATLPNAINAVVGAMGELLPELITAAAEIFSQVADTIMSLMPQLVPVGAEACMKIISGIVGMLPTLVTTGTSLIDELAEGIMSDVAGLADAGVKICQALIDGIFSATDSLMTVAVNLIYGFCGALSENMPVILAHLASGLANIVSGISEIVPNVIAAGIDLITGLITGFSAAFPDILASISVMLGDIVFYLISGIPLIIQCGIDLFTALVAALPEIIAQIVEVLPIIIEDIISSLLLFLPDIIQAGVDLLTALIANLPQIIDVIIFAMPKIITGIVSALLGNIDKIIMAGVQLLVALVANTSQIIAGVIAVVPKIMSSLINKIKEYIGKMKEVGTNLIHGLWNGIADAGTWLWNKISGFFGGINEKIKKFFGINSPSKLYRDMFGRPLAEGIGVGFELESDNVADMMTDSVKHITSRMSVAVEAEQSAMYRKSAWSVPDNNINTDNRQYNNKVTQNFYSPTARPSQVERAAREALLVK